MTPHCRAYGLRLSTDVPIPGLACSDESQSDLDLTLVCGGEPAWAQSARREPSSIEYPREGTETSEVDRALTLRSFANGEFFELSYAEGTKFLVNRHATQIHGSYAPPLTIEDLATCFVGPVCGFALRRRGITVLHASAVTIEGKAVVLCGPSGAGKSTTTAALALRGIPVICEDMAALRETGGGFEVETGYPRVCLWPDSVRALLGSENALPNLTPTWEKCFLPLDGKKAVFDSRRRPLGAVYLIDSRAADPAAPFIREFPMREALLSLVQNTYMNWLLDREQRAAEFENLGRLVARTPVRRLVPDEDPAHIGQLCDVLLEDARKVLAGRAALGAYSY